MPAHGPWGSLEAGQSVMEREEDAEDRLSVVSGVREGESRLGESDQCRMCDSGSCRAVSGGEGRAVSGGGRVTGPSLGGGEKSV